MSLTDLTGYLAACLTTCSFVPQAWLTFKTRDVRGISLGMYSVFTCGVALWLLYGLALGAWPWGPGPSSRPMRSPWPWPPASWP
jgi:MtN3 and saliva related transmembrane protein